MANELTLVLATPVEELIPAMIAWNNEELMQRVESALKQYKGAVYDDTQIDAAKKDRAILNAFAKSLNDERIRIGKVYAAPYEKFKGQVDDVVGRVKETVSEIDTQIRAYESAKAAEKQKKILEYYREVIGGLDGSIPYDKIHQSRWLNASVSMKSVKSDIDKVITDATNAMAAIEGLHSEDEMLLKAYYFRTLSLSDALMENERLKQEKARIAEMKAKQEATRAVQAAKAEESVESPKPVEAPEPAKAEVPQTRVVKFKVEGTVEQLRALSKFLTDNEIRYYAI